MAACCLPKWRSTIRRLGTSSASPIDLPPFLVGFKDALRLGFPAIGGGRAAVVLHRGGQVVQRVLLDRVSVGQRFCPIVREQVFGEIGEDELRMAARLQALERCGAALLPVGEQRIRAVNARRGRAGTERERSGRRRQESGRRDPRHQAQHLSDAGPAGKK